MQNEVVLHRFQSLEKLSASPSFKAISLFDLDHTLLNSNCSLHFGKFLYEHKVFSTAKMLMLGGLYALHKAKAISIETLQIKTFQLIFEGRQAQFFIGLAERFAKEHIENLVYQPAFQELKAAQESGAFVAILSASPDFLVKIIAEQLGVQHCEATSYNIGKNGDFLHISRFLVGKEKAAYSEQCRKQLKIEKCCITAYSDSILDLPMMESAGIKVAVRPDKKLKAISTKECWRII